MSVGIFVVSFLALIILRVPISFALGLSGLGMALSLPDMSLLTALTAYAQRIFVSVDTFVLLAIPLFILAGSLMEAGGTARRLVDFAASIVGRFRGGLGLVTVLSAMFFSGISGSASADTAAVGSVMIPAMKRKGYDGPFAAALTAGAGALGPIIPPSVLMVIYGAMANVSIGALFLGGLLPGLLIGLMLMGLVAVVARRRDYPKEPPAGPREIAVRFWHALLPLMMPVMILGGVFTGIFTATESAAVAVLWAVFLGIFVYKELRWSQVPRILYESGLSSAKVMFLIGSASFVGFLLAHQQVPQMIAAGLLTVSSRLWVVLLLVNIILLVVGCFIEVAAALIILGPVLIPVMQQLGVDLVHFGVVMTVNLAIGTIHPPVGNCLYIVSAISGESITRCGIAVLPVVAVMIAALMLCTHFPVLVLLVPHYFGH